METKICEYCGEEFTPYKKTQKFCSKECAEASKKSQTKVCLNCNKEFIASYPRQKFCSDECRTSYKRITSILMSYIDKRGADLIRYGQHNPFSNPIALWQEYKSTMKELDYDE